MHRSSWVYAALFACLAPLATAAGARFETQTCAAAAAAAGARCGVVRVPEDHANPRGRKIALSVLLLPATGSQRLTGRAQYDLEGGPGFAATDFLEFYAGEGAVYRQRRDIVLADMRGTGKSNALRCPGIEEHQERQPTSPLYPPELVEECGRQLVKASDPRQYTTGAAARDIDLIRRALGYEQLDLNAVSYGTTLALRYMAEFPRAVHAAALMGTVPASRTPPRFHAAAAQASFDRLVADCAADPACREQSGDLRANLAGSLERVAAVPTLTAPVFLEKLRNQLYTPASRAHVPYLLSLAAHGYFRGFAGAGGRAREFADGLYLSITCAESFGQMDVDAAIVAARETTFGSYRLERQRDACAHWPRGAHDPNLMREASSLVPVLFIAGEQDPVSPAGWAQETAARFVNGTVVRVPHGAHVLDGLTGIDTCLDSVIIRYFDSGSARGIDTSCFAAMNPPAFGAPP